MSGIFDDEDDGIIEAPPTVNDSTNKASLTAKELLSFRETGRILSVNQLEQEFRFIQTTLKSQPTADIFTKIGRGSGTHILKTTTPRADVEHSVLRVNRSSSNLRSKYIPSLNAPLIPFAKIVFRPLEIEGHSAKSIVEHLLYPDEISAKVLDAFAFVFGQDCLDSLANAILSDAPEITQLPDAGEFPIIFLPGPDGGDIQVTPVSPIETYMGFKEMSAWWFQKQEKNGPRPPRGRWDRQSVSAQMQNISGAIGGSRQRFFSSIPTVMAESEAGLLRFVKNGSFPRFRSKEVVDLMTAYLELRAVNEVHTNSDIRSKLEEYADAMISEALQFAAGVLEDAAALKTRLDEKAEKDVASHGGDTAESVLPAAPSPLTILMKCSWGKLNREEVLSVLTSARLRDREMVALKKMES